MINSYRKILTLTLIFTIGVNFLYAQNDRDVEIPINWSYLATPFEESIRGIATSEDGVLWVSGTNNLVAKYDTTIGKWEVFRPGVESHTYDFRDIEVIGETKIIAMAAGEDKASAVYLSEDGGKSWAKVYDNPEKQGFFDAIAFYDSNRGILVGDPINGRFFISETQDGGKTWNELPMDSKPQTQKGEYQFAASGTQLRAFSNGMAIIVSGGQFARSFISNNYGLNWESYPTPALQGDQSSGLFSVCKLSNGSFIAVGGDYAQPFHAENNVITSMDGKQWRIVPHRKFPGYLSSVQNFGDYIIAVGAVNSYLSDLNKVSFKLFSADGFHCLSATSDRMYAAGSDGLVAYITLKQVENAIQREKN
ncbi:WD40/YVTN/BNR-like repeat-containing protein [Marinigracilibium pacificum]|uniref:Sortilin N-terminal domain-containing protein n=1 Tax=Marinigracilibium pacificum TaxID=2729599 RepID=A0A848J3G5_9BACT|nr:hypothetical protein [Marinigracilibium pacificum]NMM49868.1 hypothetical protein [Marinigracilibium pacificum]